MRIYVAPAAETLFGGKTRAAVLGYLAAASKAATGYAVAKALGLGFTNVYRELARLERVGLVTRASDGRGARTFALRDADLRRLASRLVPLILSEEWFDPSAVALRKAELEAAARVRWRPPPSPGRARRPAASEELRRKGEKDRALRRFASGARSRP